MESNSLCLFHSLRWPHPQSLVTQDNHRKLHGEHVSHHLSHPFQPAPPVCQETPRVGTRLPWQQVTQRSCTQASAPSHEDPPHHPVSKNQGPNNFHLNAVIAVPSPRQASPRVTDSPNQVIRSSQTPTITRKLLGRLSNPQASVRPLTPTHFSF